MAIRSGSGSLKYPLPNQNQINAQQSAAAASAGGSASASAYGANRRYAGQKMQIAANLFNSERNRNFQAQSQLEAQNFRAQSQLEGQRFSASQQADQQQFRSNESQLYRDFQAEQAQLGRDFQTGRDAQQNQFQTERDKRLFEQDQMRYERQIDGRIEESIRKGELELDPKQQETLRQLDDDEGQKFSNDEQKREFYQKKEARKREILRSARPPKGPDATGVATQGLTYQDPNTGAFSSQYAPGLIPGSVNKEGRFEPYGADTSKDQQKQDKELEDLASKYMEVPNPKTGEKYTPEEAMRKAMEDSFAKRQGFDKARGRQQETAQAPVQEQAPAAPAAPTTGALGSGLGGQSAQPTAAAPPPEVKTVANEIRNETKDMPIDTSKETPEMRSFLEQNMESIVQHMGKPLDQVPEEARPAADFFGRYLRSSIQGEPIVLRTPDEAAMLPPDTLFIDDQGNTRRTLPKGGGQTGQQAPSSAQTLEYKPGSAHGGIRHESEFSPKPGSGWQKQGEYWVNQGPVDLSKDKRFKKKGNAWVRVDQ